jgi:uncharacterized protein involved in tellurium resistance
MEEEVYGGVSGDGYEGEADEGSGLVRCHTSLHMLRQVEMYAVRYEGLHTVEIHGQ